MDISLIIATWNNCKRLAITLAAIEQCLTPPDLRWELVLVNNNCSDRTPDVAKAFATRLLLVYVEEGCQGLSRAKNAGVQAARGDLLVFADDDVRPCPEWLMVYRDAYREYGDQHYFGGPLYSEYEGGEPPEPDILRVAPKSVAGFDLGAERRGLPPGEHFTGANWACPAARLRAVGGYDARLGLQGTLGRRRIGEELDLMERLDAAGMTAIYLPEALAHHFVPAVKCSLHHLGQSARAFGVYSLHARRPPYFLEPRPWLKARCGTGNRPRDAWRVGLAIVVLAGRWLAAKMRGRNGYEEYVSLQFCIGRLQGFIGRLRGSSAHADSSRSPSGIRHEQPWP